jgi:hypothetical protein
MLGHGHEAMSAIDRHIKPSRADLREATRQLIMNRPQSRIVQDRSIESKHFEDFQNIRIDFLHNERGLT